MKLWELKYSQKFVSGESTYYVYSPVQRISQTSIIRLCVNVESGLMVELNANLEVELVTDAGGSN